MPDFQNDSPPVVDNSLALDWRAEPDDSEESQNLRNPWRVVDTIGRVVACGITEEMARLIAAAPDMATELAGWFPIVRDTIRDLLEEDPRKASYVEGWERVEATMAALTKAGRAPQ